MWLTPTSASQPTDLQHHRVTEHLGTYFAYSPPHCKANFFFLLFKCFGPRSSFSLCFLQRSPFVSNNPGHSIKTLAGLLLGSIRNDAKQWNNESLLGCLSRKSLPSLSNCIWCCSTGWKRCRWRATCSVSAWWGFSKDSTICILTKQDLRCPIITQLWGNGSSTGHPVPWFVKIGNLFFFFALIYSFILCIMCLHSGSDRHSLEVLIHVSLER